MKKILFLILIVSLVLAVSSCKRADLADPDWDGPAGFYVLLEGGAYPALLLIDGNIHTSRIQVRVTDSRGNPLPGQTVYIEQLDDSTSHHQLDWGYFENSLPTITKVTNANGEISATFFWPVEWHASNMYIHALMVIDNRAYRGSASHIGNVPQDFIALAMIDSTD